MKYNYHTHTARCNHADGNDADYVKAAYESGIAQLGFADHVPQPGFEGIFESWFRMKPCETEGYFESIRQLKEQYKDKMDILAGFEVEYYPGHFDSMLSHISTFKPDYLILGQHFTNNEYDGVYVGSPQCTEESMWKYVEQVKEAVKTGLFSYIAHPDLPNVSCSEDIIKKAAYEICAAAIDDGIPVECNLLGLMGNRWYPKKAFFEVAGDMGCPVILGLDAHLPDSFICTQYENHAMKMLAECGITPIDKLNIRRPF
ncbi:MAG: histidinol-phosphatase [Clostridia bacterium]|nr:histidinol-phosphatase [Clostridia bacterium]